MLDDDPRWYKDAVIYEVHVRSFFDSVGDGVGDFPGLTQKLDYLQDLGVTALWLLPFYPSPLKDDGYDIADYTSIHPAYGTLNDFREFLDAAHARGLRVITELVLNHTSDQHPWFQRARRAPPGSRERDFYVWSDTPERYKLARIIFQDFEPSNWTWDPVAKAYYWHRFYSHQPDLNYDNPAVLDAILPAVDFWLGMGVDGMRLDAVPYLYEREGTDCENLPETHAFLRDLRSRVDERYANRMLLSEANQWPEDAVSYFGNGDESHMAFHFPLMPRMFMAIHMEDRFPIVDILAQTPAIPDACQWCLFLRNHDELTLEMVTDEERDYMYRAYAADARARINLGIRHRLAPLLRNNRNRIELMYGLLFSLPGTPVIYYGDEIGMGDNIYLGDRNGVRTPMQWSGDRNAGFSRANPQRLYLPIVIDPEYHFEAINVEAQQNNPNSLLWWMKRLVALRKRHKAFGRGTLEFLQPANRKILAFLRRYEEECVLVVANMSRFVQHAALDLAELQGLVPVELFGRNPFPRIGKEHYPLTLGPHSFYWFALEARPEGRSTERPVAAERRIPVVSADGSWSDLVCSSARWRLEEVLPSYLQSCSWMDGAAATVKSAAIRDSFRLSEGEQAAIVCLLDTDYVQRVSDQLVLPLAMAQGEAAERLLNTSPRAAVARVKGPAEGILFDAFEDAEFGRELLAMIVEQHVRHVPGGQVVGVSLAGLAGTDAAATKAHVPVLCRDDQMNTSLVFGNQFILKVFRHAQRGVHPEVEMGRYLSERANFPWSAPLLGMIEYRRRKAEPTTLAVLHAFVPNEGTAWQYTLDELSPYFERVLSLPAAEQAVPPPDANPLALSANEPPEAMEHLIGRYLESARMLGQRTAELHGALAAGASDPAFAPDPFTELYQRSIYQSLRNATQNALDRLHDRLTDLPEHAQTDAHYVLGLGEQIIGQCRALLSRRISAQRIRCHGDLNLCEILNTGRDFVFIDFEGDTSRSISDRRVKRAPLSDVAGMLRSFHYAAWGALRDDHGRRGQSPGLIRAQDVTVLEPWAAAWYGWVAATYLSSYLEVARSSGCLPENIDDLRLLLRVYLLEKCLSELAHEIERHSQRAEIPLRGLCELLEGAG